MNPDPYPCSPGPPTCAARTVSLHPRPPHLCGQALPHIHKVAWLDVRTPLGSKRLGGGGGEEQKEGVKGLVGRGWEAWALKDAHTHTNSHLNSLCHHYYFIIYGI